MDVISCAAPNLNEKSVQRYNPDADKAVSVSKDELYKIHFQRAKRILTVCALNGADILVLGAFGCGVFKNDPEIVAGAMTDACKELGGYFDRIDFAIKRGKDKSNFTAFEEAVKR